MNLATRAGTRFWQLGEVPFREVLFDTSLQYRRLLRLLPWLYAWTPIAVFVSYRSIEKRLADPVDGPLWPLFWAAWLPWKPVATALLALLVGGNLAALVRPRAQWARVAAFAGTFFWLAVVYSHSGVQHRALTLLTLCFFLALMPSLPRPEDATEDVRRRALLLAFGGISFVLFTYSWAGALKIWGIVDALIRTNDVLFDFDLVPLHLLSRAYKFEHPLPLSEFLIDRPGIAKVGFFAAYFVETVSFAAAYRVHLHRWWFALLAAFHVSTELTMGIIFVPATGVLVLLSCFSPFARDSAKWRAVVSEIPWLGPLLAAALYKLDGLTQRRERLCVFADEDCGLARAVIAHATEVGSRGHVGYEDCRGDRFAQLAKRHAGLDAERSLVAVSERDGERTIRFDAEAALYLGAGLNGRRGWSFLLLLVPLPVTQLAYRVLASRRRARPEP